MSSDISRRTSLKRLAWALAAGSIPSFLLPATSHALIRVPQIPPNNLEAATMQELAKQFLIKYHVPGLSVAIARHGEFVYRNAFGYADLTIKELATPSHLFRIASISKPITAVALFLLIEKRLLKLSDRVFGLGGILEFDYGQDYPELVQHITVEHLLTHTCGGWSNDRNDPMMWDVSMEPNDLIQFILQNVPLQYEPGTRFAYSNFGYCILGRVVEKITGETYSDFVTQAVLSPCGITDMQIGNNSIADKAPNEVTYYASAGVNPYDAKINRTDSYGGWIATASDLVQFAMHVDGFSTTPNILLPTTIAVMTRPTKASGRYAKGWFVNEQNNRWHGGTLSGTTSILMCTGSGLCWSALANTHTSPDMNDALDKLMWKMAQAVPAWRA